MTILAVLGLLMALSAGVLAVTGWLMTSVVSTAAGRVIGAVGAVLVGGLGVGVCLHLIRFCDATICCTRTERSGHGEAGTLERVYRWPRASSDADFLVMIVVSVGLLLAH